MKTLCTSLFTFLFFAPAAIAGSKISPLELARSFNAVTYWAVGQSIKPRSIQFDGETYEDGDLDTVEFYVTFSQRQGKKFLKCDVSVYVDYPYVPMGSTYKAEGGAKVYDTSEIHCE